MMLRTVCGVLVAGGGSVWWACLDVFVSLCVCAERLCVSVGAVGDRRYESDVAVRPLFRASSMQVPMLARVLSLSLATPRAALARSAVLRACATKTSEGTTVFDLSFCKN